MDVRACLLSGRLAFALGDVPRLLFGKERPTPNHIYVQIPGDPAWKDEKSWEQRLMWDTEHYARAKPEAQKRSIIVYGQKLAGFAVTQAPRTLQSGVRYRAAVSAGAFSGSTIFVYSSQLPDCNHQATESKANSLT